MSTTIESSSSTGKTQRSKTAKLDRFSALAGFGILMVWAMTMLLIGAIPLFGSQCSEPSVCEFFAPI